MPAGPWSCISFVPVTIHTEPSGSDLSRLRINRDAPPRLRWLPWVAVVVLAVSAAGLYPRQRALARDGITTNANLTAAEATAAVSAARVKSAEAAIASARARVRVAEEALENTNVRAPFDGVVIKKRAEVGETVSPFGVQGQASREGGAIATIADLRELEVQTEVNENNVAKLVPGMAGEVKLQAYQEQTYRGRLREILPSADRSKSIVEVRVSILGADARVKPEMSASVTFLEPKSAAASGAAPLAPSTPVTLAPKRAVTEQGGQTIVGVVTG